MYKAALVAGPGCFVLDLGGPPATVEGIVELVIARVEVIYSWTCNASVFSCAVVVARSLSVESLRSFVKGEFLVD